MEDIILKLKIAFLSLAPQHCLFLSFWGGWGLAEKGLALGHFNIILENALFLRWIQKIAESLLREFWANSATKLTLICVKYLNLHIYKHICMIDIYALFMYILCILFYFSVNVTNIYMYLLHIVFKKLIMVWDKSK